MRPDTATHRKGSTVLDRWRSTWNSDYDKTGREDIRAGGSAALQVLAYDELHRLEQSTLRLPGMADQKTTYTLDAAGNRTNVTGGLCRGHWYRGTSDILVARTGI